MFYCIITSSITGSCLTHRTKSASFPSPNLLVRPYGPVYLDFHQSQNSNTVCTVLIFMLSHIPIIPLSPASVCDFEDGSCGWYELTLGDGFDWVRASSQEVPPDYYNHSAPLDHSTNSTEGEEGRHTSHRQRECQHFSGYSCHDVELTTVVLSLDSCGFIVDITALDFHHC